MQLRKLSNLNWFKKKYSCNCTSKCSAFTTKRKGKRHTKKKSAATRSEQECLEEVARGADDVAEVSAEEQQRDGSRQEILHDRVVRGRPGGDEADGRGSQAGHDADQRRVDREAASVEWKHRKGGTTFTIAHGR
jgi:hypothetical protein